MAVNYDINYDDKRFTEVETAKDAAITESNKTYNDMISASDKYFQDQIDATKDYADTQQKNQQAQTDFAIEQIKQQKEQAQQDYIKEQSGAYADWQKQSNPYGVNAEQMAAGGMQNTGYSESSQVSMYNTYQSRVVAAREAYTRAVLNYDNAIKDAQLQNNSVLAEIAFNALQKQLELSLQGFQYKNQLILAKADRATQLDSIYYSRYQDVLNQINTENALAENVRQYNESLAFQKEQFNWQKAQAEKSSSGSSSSSSGGSGTINKTKQYGFRNTEAAKEIEDKFKTGEKKAALAAVKRDGVASYEGAKNLLDKLGCTTSGLISRDMWLYAKQHGDGGAAVKFTNYQAYLNHFVIWSIENSL